MLNYKQFLQNVYVTYISLWDNIQERKATINVQNVDNKCFNCSILLRYVNTDTTNT